MFFTCVTVVIVAILLIFMVLRLKRGSAQATRRRLHHEPVITQDPPRSPAQAAPLATETWELPSDQKYPIEYLTLHVMAPKDCVYAGYELLQTLLANGLRYGDKHIFHRHETKTGRGRVLFSVASANAPGIFELTKMGNFTCPGLTLFMVLRRDVDAMLAFDTLLETAKQLVEDLGGDILDDRRQLLNMDRVADMRIQIRRFEETQRIPDFFF